MTQSFYSLSWTDVFASMVLVLFSIGLLRWWKIGLEKTLIIGTLRTFVQLSAMGYILTYFFGQRHWLFMVGLVSLMILVASYEGYRRQKTALHIPHYFIIITGVLTLTVILVLGSVLTFILHVQPWYYPYAMIPIAGMIIGNALNTTSLTVNRFVGELEHREAEIDMLLSLGAPPRAAIHDAIRESVKAALLPTVNSMMMVGLVQLPGVMTGQILSGIDPLIAVRYQIMIMYMWVTASTMTNILVLALVYRQFFTPRQQLRCDLLRRS
ncbi:MAG: iron export ABC transporter permease subunit FetB [FCB group bacterium]|nr:iron export ABC transporter permease subunit FetB [FCB group bacterium]